MFADLHCDTITKAFDEEKALRENDLHIDLIRRKNAGSGIQNFAIFLNAEKVYEKGEDIFEKAKCYLEFFKWQMEKNDDIIMQVKGMKELEESVKQGKVAAVLTLEEGAICKGKIENLRYFYENGVRMMTLTWNYDNELAASNTTKEDYGLTGLGMEFVEQMENLGMIVDVSHLSDKGICMVADMARKPFVASHSNTRAICSHRRNLTDEMIRMIANSGGVIGLNFYENFLWPGFRNLTKAEQIKVMACHVKHLLNVGGEDVPALGSDFDGIDTNPLLPEVSCVPMLCELLNKQGISKRVLDKMYFENVMRLYKIIF